MNFKQAVEQLLVIEQTCHPVVRAFKELRDKPSDEDYDVQQTLLVDSVLHCETLNAINDVVCNNQDLFTDYDSINVFTLEGTMNYIFKLLR